MHHDNEIAVDSDAVGVSPPVDDRMHNDSDTDTADDPLRDQLLDAACRVFASKGYDGTKLMDIVRASGLSSGAVYGRFVSKDDLLLAAVIAAVERNAIVNRFSGQVVAEMLAEASRADQPLDDYEAMHLEAFIAARREPTLAAAITDARQRWRATIADPLIERASSDGSASPDADFDSVVYLVQTLHLGLLVQRGAGQHAPNGDAWQQFIERLLRSVAHPQVGDPTVPGPGSIAT
jgi:AcrR family transcriptional regulator